MEKKKRILNLLVILLLVSLLANGVILYSYIKIASPLNTTWANATQKFVQYVHWVSLDVGGLSRPPVTKEMLQDKERNLVLIEEELESIEILPYAREIAPYSSLQKIRVVANYQREIINLMKTELDESDEVSQENIERMQVVGRVWEGLVADLTREENKINPFAPVFKKKEWQKVWDKGVSTIDEIELIPLPE